MIYTCHCKYVKDLSDLFKKFESSGERIISVTPFGTLQTAVTIIMEKTVGDE